ncbi:hypothetical protein RAD16_40215 [Bradyrhizobium sp. 18BD]
MHNQRLLAASAGFRAYENPSAVGEAMVLLRARWLVLLGIFVSILTGCGGSLSEAIRYHRTINVEVDGTRADGSGVIQVKQSDTRSLFGSMGGFGNEVRGEAVAVDLGRHGTLFRAYAWAKAG